MTEQFKLDDEARTQVEQELQYLQSVDPLHLVALTAGKSHHSELTDGETFDALRLQVAVSKQKEALLNTLGDSTFSMDWYEWIEMLKADGFELVYEESFFDYDDKGDAKDDRGAHYHNVWAHRKTGFVVSTDSFTWIYEDGRRPRTRNTAVLHYNLRAADRSEIYSVSSSGGWQSAAEPYWRDDPKYFQPDSNAMPADIVWSGYHDVREGFRMVCNQLKRFMVMPYPKLRDPFSSSSVFAPRNFWNLHKSMGWQAKSAFHKAEELRRLRLTPEWFQEMVGVDDL